MCVCGVWCVVCGVCVCVWGGGGTPHHFPLILQKCVVSFNFVCFRFCCDSMEEGIILLYYCGIWKKVLYFCIYSVNTVRSILVLKNGSRDNTYLIHYHFFVTSTLCKVDRNRLQNRQLRKRLWSKNGLTFILFFFYHGPLFASKIWSYTLFVDL